MTRAFDDTPVPGDHGMEDGIEVRMNPWGRAVCDRVLAAMHAQYVASPGRNSITILGAMDFLGVMTWYARELQRDPLVPISLEIDGAGGEGELAFMLRRGSDAVRIRVGGDFPRILTTAAPGALARTPAGTLAWDTRVAVDRRRVGELLAAADAEVR